MLPRDRRTFLKSGATAAVGLTGLAGCLGGGNGDGTLGFNFTVPVENLGSLLDIPDIQDQLDNIGEEYELDVSQNSSTPDSLNALAAGESDLCLVTTVSYASAVMQEAVPGNITMLATDFWDAHADHYGFTIFSRSDSEITEPADMEGATLGVNALGTGIHSVYQRQLLDLGLDPDEDVEFVEQDFPTFTAGLEDGIFDVAIYPALFAPQARDNGFNEVFSSQDVWDEAYPFAYIVASNTALEEKESAVRSWMEDYVTVVDYMFENRDEVVSLASDHFELPESLVDSFFLTDADYYRDDIEIDTERLQYAMDEMHDMGFTDDTFDVEEYATNEYLP
ncbi:ABC transporter substrate-binding protein [Natrialba asiatica]|uniref:NMT1/THI5 like domain-containing protein n=1 Tax=Natrialba asiatica (strain ATCC 700177 / DSM 12278 / JCM 9576 / FERM P-10747 / NBRC 102637 / 172P1) TaxID=29540 RepID=M0B6D8_NATA1|nr:ABC transporter substrate-binding protein [Natrialba asiatica]ELZ05209.1 NMT1/THI5 like domain-containing protein [Natrialba asiatica DSM 12278]